MRQTDLTISRAAHGQSEEVAASIGDTIAELRLALERAQADAAALREAIRHYTQADTLEERLRGWDALCQIGAAEHPGAALLTELAAARAIVEEARMRNPVEPCLCSDCSSWRARYATYDAAVEARGR